MRSEMFVIFRGEEVTLVRDHTLNVKQGATVELLDVEKFFQLTDRCLLSPVICGLLNTRLGGKIYIGVKSCGLVRGILLERKKRDLASYKLYGLPMTFEIFLCRFGSSWTKFSTTISIPGLGHTWLMWTLFELLTRNCPDWSYRSS